MRVYLILDALGLTSICIGFLLFVPILVAIVYQEWSAIPAFGTAGIIGISIGALARILTPTFTDIHRTEGMVVVAFTWLIAALLGTIPYLYFDLGLENALFESMSGITATGATILKDFSIYPKSFFFWRSFSQWLGGLGILVLFIAVLPQFAIAGRQLFFAEAPGPTEDQLTPRIRHTAINLWALYIMLTIIEIILLSLCGMPIFDAICNSLSTVSAGGFSPNAESIMGYNNHLIEWIIIIFMFLAGTNFALQFRAIKFKKPQVFLQNSEFLFYSLVIAVSTIMVSLILIISNNEGFFDSVRTALFNCLSVLTSTGFATYDYAKWPEGAQMVLITLMFIGGSAGSSGAGIKAVRALLLLKNAFKEVIKIIHPQAVIPLKLDKQIVPPDVMKQITTFFFYYMLLLLISTLLISIIESDFLVGFIASAASLGNIGPGLGSLGPMGNYADLNFFSKGICILNMWVGRLEIMTVLVLLCPHLWRNLTTK
ncbi:MAG: TrkH family potassium uptake protein [Cyanobacteriota bacterium]